MPVLTSTIVVLLVEGLARAASLTDVSGCDFSPQEEPDVTSGLFLRTSRADIFRFVGKVDRLRLSRSRTSSAHAALNAEVRQQPAIEDDPENQESTKYQEVFHYVTFSV